MRCAEVLLILESLKYVVIAGFSALKAIFLGIVVFGLLLPGLIVLRRVLNKKLAPSSPTPQPLSDTVDRTQP